jgi:hypothetical protein
MTDIWSYRHFSTDDTVDITGFDVEAADGHIGKIDEATYDTGAGYMVVDTGWWIFGKKRILPAGVIERIDLDDNRVYVNLTKDQIRDAPDYDATRAGEEQYRQDVGDYYGRY